MATPGYTGTDRHRPLLFKTAEEMQKAIDEYFEFCDNRLVNGYDNKTNEQFAYISPAPYTMSGLARRLGMDRTSLLNYVERDEFFLTVKKARDRVAEDVETRLMEKAPTGAIFNLKNNFGWKDESKVENTVILPKPIADINVPENLGLSENK